MKKHTPVSDEEYNDILQWLNEEEGIKTESLCGEQIMRMRNTFSFQMWQLGKAYKELANAMRETKLCSMIISLVEFLNKYVEKYFEERE